MAWLLMSFYGSETKVIFGKEGKRNFISFPSLRAVQKYNFLRIFDGSAQLYTCFYRILFGALLKKR
jgi:hypothetical protein